VELPPLLLPLDPLLPPLEPLLVPLLPPLDPLPEHCTDSQSAGTAAGSQPGSLVCAWMHWYVEPPSVTSCPTE
jgi:hypothetical protein